MNDDLFQKLAASLKEGGAILRGKESPTRETTLTVVQRAERASAEDLADILGSVPDTPPAPGDECE